jgi:hypothetical protein
MKKLTMATFAFILFASSWQVFTTANKYLVVHTTPDPNSPICWEGKAFVNDDPFQGSNYKGTCTLK